MLRMRSFAVTENKELKIVEVPMPQINDYQALVKMEACGVCNGTDIKLAHHSFKNFDTYPALLGHEGVGKVVEIGEKVTSFKIGDRVLLPFVEGKLGEYFSGWGAYSEYGVVGDYKAMFADGKGTEAPEFSEGYYAQQVVPENINSVDASMIVTFREVLSAVKAFGVKPNMNIVIFGVGPVGSSFIKFLKLSGVEKVIAFDIDDKKIERALSFGADHAFNSMKLDVTETVKGLVPEGVDLVIDAVGVNELINKSFELIKNNGKVCCYGISPKLGMNIDWSKAPYNWSVNFVQWPSKFEESQAHNQIISWIKMGALKPSDFISDVIPFENINSAFDKIEKRETDMKIVIEYK
jgi:D-arabinose 1-dehydrogenase-like Zn-dependent alcohol dehydrogenase